MKDKLNQVSCDFSIVLNDSGADVFKSSRYIKRELCTHEEYSVRFIAVIYHAMDRNELGDLKTPHYHLALGLQDRCRVQTILNYLVSVFHCNENQVQIEKCNDLGAYTRYLVHLDNRDKYQYPICDIVTNNEDTLQYYFSHVRVIDERDILALIDRYPNRRDLFKVLGAKQYREWRIIINDLTR